MQLILDGALNDTGHYGCDLIDLNGILMYMYGIYWFYGKHTDFFTQIQTYISHDDVSQLITKRLWAIL